MVLFSKKILLFCRSQSAESHSVMIVFHILGISCANTACYSSLLKVTSQHYSSILDDVDVYVYGQRALIIGSKRKFYRSIIYKLTCIIFDFSLT